MAVQELQRAVSGAFYGLLLGLGLAVLASLGWDYIPMALPTAYQPVIVAGLILVVVIFVGANTSSRA
jgi:ABC-type antimicrobial peptide transport system permease subunit